MNAPSSTKNVKNSYLHQTLETSNSKYKNMGNLPQSGIPVVVTADPLMNTVQNRKKLSGPNKFSQTLVGAGNNNANLYSMIY
jgi:hypothetical protein